MAVFDPNSGDLNYLQIIAQKIGDVTNEFQLFRQQVYQLVGTAKLKDTTVVAGTYGDSTHVGQFTVAADGRLTAASDVAISGLSPNAITALTGDGTATGPGSVALTLATVNSSPGTFGSATKTVTATVNGKGLITAISEQSATPAESSVTFTDITTNDVSTTKHGYYPKLGSTPVSMTRYKYQRFYAYHAASTGVSGVGQNDPTVTSPTAATNGNDADGPGIIISTAASSGSTASIEPAAYNRVQRRNGTIYFYAKLSMPQTINKRVWVGLSSATSTGGSGTDPTPNIHSIGFYMNPASGVSATNWLAVSNNGSASSSISDTGVAFGTSVVTLEFTIDTSGNMTWSVNGAQTNSRSTQPPGSTNDMGASVKVGAATAAQKDVNFKCLEFYFAP